MRDKKSFLWILFVLLGFIIACRDKQTTLSVSEVIQNANSLIGRTVRVRGQAYLWIDPSREEMWMYGGCAPTSSPSKPGNVVGWLTLYDEVDPEDLRLYGAPHDDLGVKISEVSFHCKGNYCTMTCTPFQVSSHNTYEFIGVLRVKQGSELILEEINLSQSRQLVDGKWLPVPSGDFDLMFP